MENAVHPELAKRIVRTMAPRGSMIEQQSAMTLVQATRTGFGTQTPEARRLKDVTILDVYENAASVKIVASDWVDYLHVARWNGSWKIVNVLWGVEAAESLGMRLVGMGGGDSLDELTMPAAAACGRCVPRYYFLARFLLSCRQFNARNGGERCVHQEVRRFLEL
jgi:hypothetical protein